MPRYIDLDKQLVRLYRLNLTCEDVIKEFLLSAETVDVPESNVGKWIPVEEQNPEIDMSYPHSECYLVTYEGGTLDVARWSNVNPFWTDHVTEPRWWGQQFCKVIAWMPLPESWKGAEDDTE